MKIEHVRAMFWWVGFVLIAAGAALQWGWPAFIIGAGVSLAAYATLNR